MGFNYAREKTKFETEWKKKAMLYRSAGMSEDSIQILRDDAWNEFKSDRNYALHTQELPEDQRINTSYFLSLTITASEEELTGRYDWIETLNNSAMVHKLRQLDINKLEMLTLVSQDGLTQEEAAIRMGIPYRTFKYQWSRLKKYLKNF